MSGQFRSLDGAEKISCTDLTFSRARALLDAIRQHRDFSLLGTFRLQESPSFPLAEVLVTDVSCDGIPPSNPAGIEYIERLALCVPEDPQCLIDVRALRLGFPLLMHQYSVLPGMAPSLCLYQEPPRSVSRTWTAPSFLKRIQYWLEQSARGTLHAADQPAEQLFLESPFELVLPWNFESLRTDPKIQFWVERGHNRPGLGGTFFLKGSTAPQTERTASIVNLSLAPVVQGRVEYDFGTLGQLSDALSGRGVELLESLISEIHNFVGEGIEVGKDSSHTILLMHIPILKAEGEQPSRIVNRAYLVMTGILKLGMTIGAIYKFERKYYRDINICSSSPEMKVTWKTECVYPMEVLKSIDRHIARFQSGIVSAGPSGALIGVGALGSSLLDMWTRSGWGEWSVIDNDHIKPHNLVRHQANYWMIGMSKAEAAIFHINSVMQGATKEMAIHADACNLSDGKVLEALRSSNLVVDASTTLDYPRLISSREDVGRHVSVFVTPGAGAGVLLFEDADREKRLRTLEAQYYRAILSEDWGHNHLDENRRSFWSGASCRDISVVMPYSVIVGYAATFADQIPRLFLIDEAAIRIWSRDEISGVVSVNSVDVSKELHLTFDGLDLFIDAGVYRKMASLRDKHLPAETGGILLGYHDFNINSIIVVDALPAPNDSNATSGGFERGLEGVIEAVVEAERRTAGIVGYIGEWHSHPKGCSTTPSGDDKYQLVYLAQGLGMEGLPAVMLIIGDNGLSALKGVAR